MHCRKHVPLDNALEVIDEWVASCISDAPIKYFDSPLLSPRLLIAAAAAGISSEVVMSSSTQDSFDTFPSEDSFVSDVAMDADALFLDGTRDGWGPELGDLHN